MTGSDVVDQVVERLRRREELGRWLLTAGLSLLIHLGLLLLLASSALDASPPVEAEPDETVVPLTFEPEPEPAPEPEPQTQPETAPPEPEEEAAEQEEPDQPEEQDLIGWQSQGDEPGRQERPPGPSAPVRGPPEPSEQQGTELEAPEADESPEGPDELPQQEPGEREPEPVEGPAAEQPEELDPRTLDQAEQPEEAPPVEQPEPEPALPRPPGELFPKPDELPRPDPEPPRTESDTERDPEPLPLPTPRRSRPERQPDRGGVRQQLPGMEAEIQGGYFNQNLKFDSKDYQWSDYATKLYFAVYRAWLRELHGRIRRFERDQTLQNLRTLDGQVAIHFTIHRDGSVSRLQMRSASPMPALDEASKAALKRAVIPPLPDDFPRDSEGVTFGFELRGFRSAQQLERQLEWSRARGQF